MNSDSVWSERPGARVERGIVTFEGREYVAGGAYISGAYLVGYPHFPDGEHVGARGEMRAWDGTPIGTCRIISSRPAVFFGHRSHIGDRWYYIRATVDGNSYSGAGFGHGMLFRGRRVKGGA